MNDSTYYMDAGEIASTEGKVDSSINDSSHNISNTQEVLNGFLDDSLSKLTGEAWDAVRDDLKTYSDCLEYAQQLNNLVLQANEEYFQTIQKFLEPDTDLNTADLPKFESEKAQLESEIAALKAENAELEKIPKTITVQDGVDENGNPIMKEVPNPAYIAGQQKIAENNNRIETILQPELDEKIRLINKINEFLNVVLPELDKKLDEVAAKVNEFKSKVQDIALAVATDSDKVNKYDMETKEGRLCYIYDQLTQKYGYSEWGAKAIIAHMQRENGEFKADRFQGDNGPNAGYGLIQWEYAKYGGWSNRAQEMEDWCKANGLDHTTIDGQLAYLDYEIQEMDQAYHINLHEELKTATEGDYLGVGTRFGTYMIGKPAGNSYNRLQDGNTKYKLFPIIDNREGQTTVSLPETPALKKYQVSNTASESTTPTTSSVVSNTPAGNNTPVTTSQNYEYSGYGGYGGGYSVGASETAPTASKPVKQQKSKVGTCPICGGNLIMSYDENGSHISCDNYPVCSYSQWS